MTLTSFINVLSILTSLLKLHFFYILNKPTSLIIKPSLNKHFNLVFLSKSTIRHRLTSFKFKKNQLARLITKPSLFNLRSRLKKYKSLSFLKYKTPRPFNLTFVKTVKFIEFLNLYFNNNKIFKNKNYLIGPTISPFLWSFFKHHHTANSLSYLNLSSQNKRKKSHYFNPLNFHFFSKKQLNLINLKKHRTLNLPIPAYLNHPYFFLNHKSTDLKNFKFISAHNYWVFFFFKSFNFFIFEFKKQRTRPIQQPKIYSLLPRYSRYLPFTSINDKNTKKLLNLTNQLTFPLRQLFPVRKTYLYKFKQPRIWFFNTHRLNVITSTSLLKNNQLPLRLSNIKKLNYFPSTGKKYTNYNLSRPILKKNTLLYFKPFRINFFTKTKLDFLFPLIGFLFITIKKSNLYSSFFLHQMRKKIYNFFEKNDILTFISSQKQHYDFFGFKNINNLNFSNFYLTLKFTPSLIKNFNLNRYHLFIKSRTSTFSDISIKRIKFKPGYSRLWRESRSLLNQTLFLNFNYQRTLTRYLVKLNSFSKLTFTRIHEFKLFNILKLSKFFLNPQDTFFFFNHGLVFLNGYPVKFPSTQLFVNDFVQLVVNLRYYLFYKTSINISLKKKIKLNQIVKYHNSLLFYLKKKKLPSWIFTYLFLNSDTPSFLEIDFFSLSIFVVFEPLWLSFFNHQLTVEYKSPVLNLYNWKYIT